MFFFKKIYFGCWGEKWKWLWVKTYTSFVGSLTTSLKGFQKGHRTPGVLTHSQVELELVGLGGGAWGEAFPWSLAKNTYDLDRIGPDAAVQK